VQAAHPQQLSAIGDHIRTIDYYFSFLQDMPHNNEHLLRHPVAALLHLQVVGSDWASEASRGFFLLCCYFTYKFRRKTLITRGLQRLNNAITRGL
jgi:hypothetical protein